MSSEGKPTLLYIMGIDWAWIFQRPQIIAQHLAEGNDITIVFPRSILKFFSRFHARPPVRHEILWTLPLQEKVKIIGRLSQFLNSRVFRDVRKYGTIVVGYPLYYRYIPHDYSGTLIYDCMDNHETLYPYRPGVGKLLEQEKALLEHSRIVFASSGKLVEKIRRQVEGPVPRVVLLRNGTAVPGRLPPVARPACRSRHKIAYVGTIAEWFDRELILESLEKVGGIEYHLIGPVNIALPRRQRGLIMEGVVPHSQLYGAVESCSCLVMPFRTDKTVLYVDPVKLYEYIVMGKCIIAVYYPEIERFGDFVYFYRDAPGYVRLLEKLKTLGFPPKYTSRQRQDFLAENTWETRFAIWDKAVNEAG